MVDTLHLGCSFCRFDPCIPYNQSLEGVTSRGRVFRVLHAREIQVLQRNVSRDTEEVSEL